MIGFVDSIRNLFTKKQSKKNELFSIFISYIETVNKLNTLKTQEKLLEIKKIENQLEEYYLPVSTIYDFIDLTKIEDTKLFDKIKHISDIKPEQFTFVDLYATPTEEGVTLTLDKKSTSELVRIVSYKKV